jgi:hypothetical protein
MMPPVERALALALAIATGLALLGAIGLGVYAGFLRYRGRPVPARVLRLAVGLLGAGHGTAFIYFIKDPFTLAPLIVIPALLTYWLVRGGRRVAAGILLATLGLPGALWWGFFLVQDLVDPLDLYEPVLWLWWAPEVALLIIGALVASRGDRSAPPAELIKRTPEHVRDPIALANAFHRELAVGTIQFQTLVAVGVASPLLVLGLPFAIQAGLPWPLALVLGPVAYAVVWVELWQIAMPRRVRSAWEGFTLVANPETKRWQETTGAPVPRTRLAMLRWLRRTPDRPETRWVRSQLLVTVGELAEARDVAERMPIETDRDRFDQRTLFEYIEWVRGGEADLDALRRQAETVGEPGSMERLWARGEVAIAIARDLADSGGDWMAPLKAIRDEAGPALASRLFHEESRRQLYPQLLLVGAAFSGFIVLVSLLAG